MHARLGDDLVHPALKGFGAALGVARGLPFGLQAGFEVGNLFNALQQVGFEAFEQARQVGQQLGGVDHERRPWFSSNLIAARAYPVGARGRFDAYSCQRSHWGGAVLVFYPGLRQCQGAGVVDVVDQGHGHAVDGGQALGAGGQ